VQESVARSRLLLQRDTLDLVFVHSHGRDEQSLARGEAVEELLRLKEQGAIRAVGFSGKTPAGAVIALQWADAIMVEFNLNDQTHADVMAQAAAAGKGVIVKKGLASGHLQPGEAIRFVLGNAAVTSMVIGGLNAQHMEANVQAALGTPD
jgi:aryl-alcohol dehydrogenase-like predicted oxidoreductase